MRVEGGSVIDSVLRCATGAGWLLCDKGALGTANKFFALDPPQLKQLEAYLPWAQKLGKSMGEVKLLLLDCRRPKLA
eukprot:461372-Amphidinium_carterae.1